MKKYIYSQHDERAGFYNHPQISEIEPEAFAVNTIRAIKLSRDPKQLSMIADCKLYQLGLFDDDSGKFDIFPDPKLLVECDKLIESLGFVNEYEQPRA